MNWKEFLEKVAEGKTVFNTKNDGNCWPTGKLTEAEKNVLVAILPTFDGGHLPQKDVAQKLHIEVTTVKSHLDCIYGNFLISQSGSRIGKLHKKLQAEFNPPLDEISTPQIDWRTDCEKQLNKQKEQLTSSPIQGLKTRKLDDVHVPLGVMERKNKERPQFGNSQEISQEKGSESYQQGYTETKRIEHDKFLAEMYKREPGKHIVILGEPGAGKTTILTRIWQELLYKTHSEKQIIVAWVPLTAVKNDGLEDYLKNSWIKQFCKSEQIPSYWKSFEELADVGRVWLLLDGVDEMGGDALGKIKNALNEKWAESIKAIATCRLNLWDASPTNSLASSQDFRIYRTLDFKYDSPAGDEVEKFIDKWFENQPATGKKLRSALDEVGKERIKDLVQNPLRLTLLCDIWEDKNELPDTQANLYYRFVDYVYKFKADEFPKAYNLRGSLDRAMGVLAKQGINKANLRFRFNREELEEALPDIEHREALKDLGWLNCLGEDEDRQEVYAFFHPTFQEYFAACNIDDWDYFLPRAHIDRPVICQGESVPTYRVFEQEWQQVMLYWIGRTASEISDETREEFIKSLTNFQRQEGSFYSFRAYCMAAILVGEFKSCRQAESIVAQIIKFAFGHFNSEKKQWESYSHFELVESSAKATIPLTHRQYSIQRLQTLLKQHDSDNNVCNQMWEILEAISPNRQMAKQDILEPPSFEYYKHPSSLNSEEREQRIEKAITILNQNVSNNYFMAIKMLGEIAVGHEGAIEALTTFIGKNNRLDRNGTDLDGYRAAVALGKIAVGNESAIKALIDLLQDDNVHHNVCSSLFIAIGTIVTKSEMSLVIGRIKKYITREALESNFHRFKICHMIILQCAQSLTYPEFYQAWHQPKDPVSSNQQLLNNN